MDEAGAVHAGHLPPVGESKAEIMKLAKMFSRLPKSEQTEIMSRMVDKADSEMAKTIAPLIDEVNMLGIKSAYEAVFRIFLKMVEMDAIPCIE